MHKLQKILDSAIDNKKIFGTSFAIKKNDLSWIGAAGNISTHHPYFIASTTKLFTTAIILNLESKGKLNLNDKISKYLESNIIKGLHNYKGKDFSNEIIIKHLLAHTSGIADYFRNTDDEKNSLEFEITNGKDQFWTFEQSIKRAKEINPLFAPGSYNKASYSDTNFQLLGRIIENITNKTFNENLNEKIISLVN